MFDFKFSIVSVKEFEYHKVLLDEKLYNVGLKWTGKDKLSIELDHRIHSVELHGSIVLVDGKQYELKVYKIDEENFLVKTPKRTYRAKIPIPTIPTRKPYQPQPVDYKMPTGGKTVVEEGAVTAPMAGRIVLIKKDVGDSVKMGETVCILEAMKMENSIIAPKTGIVEEVRVEVGATVKEKEVLVKIK